MPTIATCPGVILGPTPPTATSSGAPSPSSAATTIPCTLPDGVVRGVLMSACASTHSTPVGPPCAASATVPMLIAWSPPRKITCSSASMQHSASS